MTNLIGSSDVGYLLYSVLPLDWMWSLSRFHGRLTYLVSPGRRSVVRRNLASAGGGKTSAELDALTRQFFEFKRLRGLLLALAPRLSSEQLAKLLPLEGLEHLDAALERNQGVILLGSHLNSLCLFPATISLRGLGYDVRTALPEPEDPWRPTWLWRMLDRTLDTQPVSELIGAFYAQFNIRPIVRLLADNAVVTQTGDGLHSARFVDVDFLGRKIPFPTGMASVAQLTGAVVVPVFQVGALPDRMRVLIEEPWTVAREEVEEGALQNSVAAYAKRLEHHLLENLACWEHWLIEDTLATIATWPQKPLTERYAV